MYVEGTWVRARKLRKIDSDAPPLDIFSHERSLKMETGIVMWTVIGIMVGIVLILIIKKIFR